ncbi:hypothetical protein BH10PSE19_BH10PSE19_04100 [soil metagenome]
MNLFRTIIAGILLSVITIIPAYAKNRPNLVSLEIPAGTGFLWCEITPTNTNPYHEPMNKFILKSMSAFVAGHCVQLSGMRCGPFVSSTKSSLETDLWEFSNHYFKYQKNTNDKSPYCRAFKNGNVQIRVDYDYQLRCFTSKKPPKGLLSTGKKMC